MLIGAMRVDSSMCTAEGVAHAAGNAHAFWDNEVQHTAVAASQETCREAWPIHAVWQPAEGSARKRFGKRQRRVVVVLVAYGNRHVCMLEAAGM